MVLDPPDQIALHDLHVIAVELDIHVRPSDARYHVGRLLDARQEIIRPVPGVQRLDQQPDALAGCGLGSPR